MFGVVAHGLGQQRAVRVMKPEGEVLEGGPEQDSWSSLISSVNK